MNLIEVKVNFADGTCTKSERMLITGDYNSTKLVFDFDREDGTKIFELKGPSGELVFMKEIENNEITLVGIDENGELCSIFSTAGEYIFEISLYNGDSKLTSAYNCLYVQQEQVEVDGKVLEYYLPIFDQWLREIKEQSAYAQEQGDYAKGVGEELEKGKTEGLFKGEKGDKGDTGEPGKIKYIIAPELPTENIDKEALYFIPKDDPTTQDMYDEYAWLDEVNDWEYIGNKEIKADLTEYAKIEYVDKSIQGLVDGDIANLTELITENQDKIKQVDRKIGDIDTALDLINGEVID